jgi:eukaryotic-like serine/threonine-protein kinase
MPLNSKNIFRKETAKDWALEKIQYDAVYDNEKIISYLFLPKNAKPPFQTVIYLPGSAVFFQQTSDSIENYYEFPVFLDYIVKTGRAVLFPVYYGTFERKNDFSMIFAGSTGENRSHQLTDYLTRFYKDFEQSINYLESRTDIKSDKIALYGMSHGSSVTGPIFSALDQRIKVNVFVSGGLVPLGRPEANSAYYLARIKQPTLMINGRFDSLLGEDNIRQTFKNIGAKDKSLKLFETDHIPPREGMVRETLAWLDKYLGPVSP